MSAIADHYADRTNLTVFEPLKLERSPFTIVVTVTGIVMSCRSQRRRGRAGGRFRPSSPFCF